MDYAIIDIILQPQLIRMSQKGSSIVSGENSQLKYKKALMEIQKIHTANKVLKNQSEEMKADYQRQINQLSLSYEHISKEHQIIKNDKAELQKFLEELQVSNSELRKEYNNLEREVTYLNDVLTEQNAELKKVNAFKDEKCLSTLITSYQDRQLTYRKDISRLEEIIKNLKSSCETLENDLAEESRQRYKLEDLNNNLKMEISRYRQLNTSLLSKNQSIVASLLSRTSEGKEKYREAENVLGELGRQLQMVKSARVEQQTTTRTTVSLASYEAALQDKNKIEAEVARLRQRIEDYESRSKDLFETEEKMKKAMLRGEQLSEQCNMLKSKLIMIETKDLMEGSMAEDTQLKQFEDKVIANMGLSDPLQGIKNSGDSSHFQLMKRYVVELKEKLGRATAERRQTQKKYRSLKEKAGEKVEKAIGLQEQNKLLKGKLQGFERLTERLQYELQMSMQVHQQELNQMKSVTTNLINKKSEQTKTANAFVRAQLDLEMDKFDKIEKGLRQEIEALRLENSTEKIKNTDLTQKLQQATEFLNIYKNKFTAANAENNEAEETNQILADNALRYEQLYRQERAKNQALLGQKQLLGNKINQLSEQLQKKWQLQEEVKSKDNSADISRLKAELTQTKTQLEQEQTKVKSLKKQIEDKNKQPVENNKNNKSDYRITLEDNYTQQREKNKKLDAELQTLKVRLDRAVVQSQRVSSLEDALNAKNDELNDTKRKNIAQQKQTGVLQAQLKQLKTDLDNTKKESNALKLKLVEGNQEIRKNYESKDLDNKKSVQKISEELSIATSQLREEKRVANRLQNDLINYKAEVQRLENAIEQTKSKEHALYDELEQLRNSSDSISEECERLKSQLRFKTGVQDGLNEEITASQDRIYKLNQENSQLRLKTQAIENEISELRRELNGVKVYLTEVEQYANSKVAGNNWQEQRERDNLNNFVQKIKKIVKTSEISQASIDRPPLYGVNINTVPDYSSNIDYSSFEPTKYEAPALESPSFNYRTEFNKYAAYS